jgi:putative tryptophan/tyrosine transport system substrate-binding protein
MRRRELLSAIGGAVAWPIAAWAQQTRKIPRVGVLWHAANAEEEAIYLAAFQEGLKGMGYIDGRTISLEHRFPNEIPERFVSMAAELAANKPDVLVAVSPAAALAAKRATSTIPIIFIVVHDPVRSKLVQSLAHPGGNITGLTHITVELSAKRLALFKEAFPRMTRVALLVNPNDQQTADGYIQESQAAAISLGLTIYPAEVRGADDFARAFEKIAEQKLEGVAAAPDGLLYQNRAAMAQLALKHGLPLMAYSRETLEAGATMSYGADVRALFRRASFYLDKVLKGEKSADLPVEQPTKFEFLINIKTAKALGLELSPALLARADEVIE